MARKFRALPSQEELLRLLDYNQEDGSLTWRLNGKTAGTVTKGRHDGSNRYLVVGIRRQQYASNRLIFKMMTGRDPAEFIDHADGDNLNMRWSNLREATNGQNLWNAKLRSNNKSGIKGVMWDKQHKKWRSYISDGNRQIKLGRFGSIEEAARVVNDARVSLHGEFARMK
jgi:hypothetical protein